MSSVRKMRLFRVVDGARVPVIFEVDSEMTILGEYNDVTDINHVARGRKDGGSREDPIRVKSRLVAQFAAVSVEDCPIPGAEDLREQYFRERDQLLQYHAQRGSECPACELGALIRKYREKLEREHLL